jgi:hypothetical protein
MHLIFKATYHDRQKSYNRQAHITDDFGNVVCGRNLNEFWDVFSEWYPSLEVLLQNHDSSGVCANCRHSKHITKCLTDHGQSWKISKDKKG